MNVYCLRCKLKTENIDEKESETKNNRRILQAKCVTCGKNKCSFIKSSKSGGDIVSFVDNSLKKIGLQGLPEMHLPGHNFTGPGTRLDKRLDPVTDEPYEWSKPINKVDEISLHHDKCYRDNPDRKHCDKVMLKELDEIKNPTARERIERGIVKSVIWPKSKLGLGVKKRKPKKPKNYTSQ